MREDVSYLKKMAFISFEWFGALKNSTYIACSRSEQIKISTYIPFRKCILVENAVKYLPAFNDRSDNDKTIVTVGQIRSQKGPIEFASIARKVRSKMPDLTFRWVGDGEAASKKILLDAGVEVTGWVNKKQVIDYLTSSTLYLSTARWEGMPVSIIEAHYARLPVVASRCSGNVDVVAHGETGWLFDSDFEASELVLTTVANPSRTSKIVDHAYKEAQRKFSSERYVRDMVSLIVK